MGLDRNGVRLLLHARRLGADFSSVATIGRQTLFLTTAELRRTLREMGEEIDRPTARSLMDATGGYAEAFLRHLGAQEVHSYDVSAYEGASHLHDMNVDIAAELRDRYSLVVDGGSLEHVFNFPVALRNCMEMVRPGGHFLGIGPTNNFMGHGFYQFSPELYFRTFSPQNGFRVVTLLLFEDHPRAEWYEVADPESVRCRVTLRNRTPTYLSVLAERLERRPIFENAPQQSDYVTAWRDEASLEAGSWQDRAYRWLRRHLPDSVRIVAGRRLQSLRRVSSSRWDPRHYRRVDPTAGPRDQ